MKKSAVKWLLAVLRYGLCVAALVFLYYAVEWNDRVVLKDNPEKPYRLLAESEDGQSLTILRDGEEEVIPLSAVRRVGEKQIPDIRYGIRSIAFRTDPLRAAIALLLFVPVPFMAGLRLTWMLRIQEVALSWWSATKLTVAGNFFNFALPGSTGGDLFKAYYVTKHTQHKTEAVTTIFLDRVIGLIGLMGLATVMMAVAAAKLDWEPSVRRTLGYGLLMVWGGLFAGAIVVFSKRLREFFRLPKLVSMLPAGNQLQRIGRTVVKMRAHKSLLAWSLGLTIVLQGFVVISAYVMALALGMHGPWTLYFICVPIGFLIVAVPIFPPQGFGVMEGAYVLFFATENSGNTASQAVAFALAVRLIQLVWALPGVLVPLLGAHMPTQAEFDSLDETVATDSAPDDEPPADSRDAEMQPTV